MAGAKCESCGTERYMEFHCVLCCVKWLSQMTKAEMLINAPVIQSVMGLEHMNKVREAWGKR